MADEKNDKPVKSAWIEMESDNKTSLKKIMKPALICLAMVGSYNFKEINSGGSPSWKSYFTSIYRGTIFLILLFMTCRVFAAFFYLHSAFFNFNLIIIVALICVQTMFLINLKGTSSRYGHFEKVFKFWEDKIMPEFKEIGVNYDVSKINKKSFIVLTFAFINIVINIAGAVTLSEGIDSYAMTAPIQNSTVTVAITIAIYSIVFASWILPTAFVIIFSIVLQEAFNSFNDSTSKACEQYNCKMAPNFKKIRLLHLNLCKLVCDLDQDLSWYYGTEFVFSMGLGVFTLYQVLRTQITTIEIAVFMFWCVSNIFYLGLTTIFAAFVHESAHAPLDCIYYLNVQDITVEELAQLNMFLSKLTGTQVGFSANGLLVINKEFILTIAGVFLTYFAVLYTL